MAIDEFFQSLGHELDEDAKIMIREAELHTLVKIHKIATSIVDACESEFEYRIDTGEKLAAGNDEERDYARRNSYIE